MKLAFIVLSLSAAAEAWTGSGPTRPSPLPPPAASDAAAGGTPIDVPSDVASPVRPDRRTFLASAASASLLAASAAFGPPGTADAAVVVDATPYSRVYRPAPHSMDGKVVVITGGNTGLGLESAKRLAEAGATVVFTSRDVEKGRKALEEVNAYLDERTGGPETFVGGARTASLDLCDLSDVKSFAGRLADVIGKDSKVDVLMNNAGVMAVPDLRLTGDGYERTFQTNHLGHFALTSSVLPLLSPTARVINVSSMGYMFASKNGLELDNLNGEREYGPWSSYGLSKLENILFTNELQRRASASEAWSGLTAYSLHPGAVQTDLARYVIGEEKFKSMKENGFSSWTDKVFMEGLAKFVKTVQEGASTQVFLAASADVGPSQGGKFFNDGKVTSVQEFARDPIMGEELWEVSERLAGVKFNL